MGVPGQFSIVRCDSCGLAFTNPRPSLAELDAFYPDDYDEVYRDAKVAENTPKHPGGKVWPIRLFRKLAALPYRVRWGEELVYSLPPGKALDVGAGGGWRLAQLLDRGWETWILEPREDVAFATAAKLGVPKGQVIVSIAEEADVPDDTFDLITMDHVIEHLDDPRVVVDALNRWLKPGGRLLVTCPNYGSLESRILGRRWRGIDIPRHLVHFERDSLIRIASESGFELEDLRPQFGVMLNGSFVIWQSRSQPSRRRGRAIFLKWILRLPVLLVDLLLMPLQVLGYMPNLEATFRKTPDDPRLAPERLRRKSERS